MIVEQHQRYIPAKIAAHELGGALWDVITGLDLHYEQYIVAVSATIANLARSHLGLEPVPSTEKGAPEVAATVNNVRARTRTDDFELTDIELLEALTAAQAEVVRLMLRRERYGDPDDVACCDGHSDEQCIATDDVGDSCCEECPSWDNTPQPNPLLKAEQPPEKQS